MGVTKQAEKPAAQKPSAAQLKTAFEVGKCYFIRTVTYHLTGRYVGRDGDFLLLEDAAWIAESGRFTQAIAKGELSEVEPVEDVRVNAGSIVDAFEWRHALPRSQK